MHIIEQAYREAYKYTKGDNDWSYRRIVEVLSQEKSDLARFWLAKIEAINKRLASPHH